MATLVTGAFGCIGAWVCKGLLDAGEPPIALDVGDDPGRMRMIGVGRVTDVAALQRSGRLDARELEPAR